MKKVLFSLSILISLVSIVVVLTTFIDEKDICLDDGGCWDYIRNRCEYKDQGYCERDEYDCINRNGKWLPDRGYCVLH